jgi:hypothetical protein
MAATLRTALRGRIARLRIESSGQSALYGRGPPSVRGDGPSWLNWRRSAGRGGVFGSCSGGGEAVDTSRCQAVKPGP